jgi:hypothetical protein
MAHFAMRRRVGSADTGEVVVSVGSGGSTTGSGCGGEGGLGGGCSGAGAGGGGGAGAGGWAGGLEGTGGAEGMEAVLMVRGLARRRSQPWQRVEPGGFSSPQYGHSMGGLLESATLSFTPEHYTVAVYQSGAF